MNKKRKISVTGIAMMILAMFLYGCEPEPVPVTGISLDTTELSLAVGESADLKVTVEPADATEKTVTWNAEPAGIVKVTPGKDGCFTLRGLNSGNAVFGVTAGDRTADCIVSVSSLRLNRTAASLLFDETVDLTALVSADAAEQTVSWSAEPAGAVELDFEGNFCTVIPVDNGTVTVTASAGPAKAVCTINSRVFVDDAFVAAVGEQCATWKKESNGRVKLTPENREAMKAVTNLNLNGKGLTDLSDIEWFTGLTDLFCDNNPLTELDVSACTALTRLACQTSELVSLNVSGCTMLEYMSVVINNLTELDVSDCTALEQLVCHSNQLTTLDVSACTALKRLECQYNLLTSLNLSDLPMLDYFICNANRLSALDVSGCTALGSAFVCGAQTSDGTTPQTLMLTLTADQKTKWDSEWEKTERNKDVNTVVKE